jgi:hypothetical protein
VTAERRLPHEDLRARARDAADTAEQRPSFPREYVADVRAAAASLAAPPDARADDIRAAVAMLEARALVSDVVPVDSRNRPTRVAKTAVRKAVFFTTHHLASQISALGWSVAWLGNATADRIEALERELRDVKERLARLERDDRTPGS